ncbi:MAG TPA: hypothetical protein VJS44_01125 [Pyrinomonadaceae bacterium]|nr:hypothetical protein [Pyrinomonadaceae bacterium]
MAEEKKDEGQRGGSSSDAEQQTGDPGRTPGTAEGDRETVEQDLENREGKD